jgi:hypothetical protein
MSMNRRLDKLEARHHPSDDEDREDIIRMRRLDEKIKACVQEDPALYRRYQDSLDDVLEAEEQAKSRGDDPEDDPEVLAATRFYEEIEAQLLDENNDERK